MLSQATLVSNRVYLGNNVGRLERYLRKYPLPALLSEANKEWETGDTFNQNQLVIYNHDAVKSILAACKDALKRIDKGTYGVCVKCGEEINEDRLVAQPQASRCRPCQEKIGLRVR